MAASVKQFGQATKCRIYEVFHVSEQKQKSCLKLANTVTTVILTICQCWKQESPLTWDGHDGDSQKGGCA